MRKSVVCIQGNKAADQLELLCKADQQLCFCYVDRVQFLYFLNELHHEKTGFSTM